ncbi:MAG TPA: phosphatase domain-containing protein [Terriglobales bacterium]|nr:phosphatase domain-containing protein [Terriglobales bacterium]
MALFGALFQPPPAPIIYRCDLDKTYLATRFESLRSLARIPFEKAEDKRTLPGVIALIRGLRTSATAQQRDSRLYFLSGSPPQIGEAVRGKLALDGIEYDGILFKDQLRNIFRGRFRNLREQVGYKLVSLLHSRKNIEPDHREVLLGDDWESDPLIYSLYADVLSGRVEPSTLRALLVSIEVDPELLEEATALAEQLVPSEVVSRIYIHLEKRTPPISFAGFGPRLVPTFNYMQTAASLYEMSLVDENVIREVAIELTAATGHGAQALLNSLADLVRRGHLTLPSARRLEQLLAEAGLVPQPRRSKVRQWTDRLTAARIRRRPWQPNTETIDYQNLIHPWSRAV